MLFGSSLNKNRWHSRWSWTLEQPRRASSRQVFLEDAPEFFRRRTGIRSALPICWSADLGRPCCVIGCLRLGHASPYCCVIQIGVNILFGDFAGRKEYQSTNMSKQHGRKESDIRSIETTSSIIRPLISSQRISTSWWRRRMLLTYKPLLRAISYIGEGWQNSSRSFYFNYR